MSYPGNYYLPPTIFIPSALLITAITQANNMVVTVSVPPDAANTYIIGQLVRLNVPWSYGMFQANGLTGQIIAINDLNFTLNIDSSQFDPFVIPTGNVTEPASLAPSGSRNLEFNNFTGQIPFQPLNDIGN
jgi:hypothetical protein